MDLKNTFLYLWGYYHLSIEEVLFQCDEVHGVFPTLLERDFNIPPMSELLTELKTIEALQQAASKQNQARVKHSA